MVSINTDGSERRELTSCDGWILSFVWSPDSKQIAYSMTDYNTLPKIYVMNSDGTGKKVISEENMECIVTDWK